MKTILVIEDNTDIRENTAEILGLADYRVLTAANGKEGVALAKQEKPDLILCDIMMPELDGYGVLRILGSSAETDQIPFIFLTAKSDREDFRKGMTLEANDYITKPFDDLSLLDSVEMRLRKSERMKGETVIASEPATNLPNGLEELNQLINKEAKPLIVRKKQAIFSEGSYPMALYYIRKGKVKTYKMNPEGREFISALHGEGDFIGYLDLLENSNHTESAATLEDTELVTIGRQDFFALLYRNQEVAQTFIKLLSKNLAQKETQLLKLAYDSVRKRVAETLVALHERFSPQSETASIQMSREDLSNMIGASKETVIRTLSDFKSEKLIDITASGISILNLTKLQKMKN